MRGKFGVLMAGLALAESMAATNSTFEISNRGNDLKPWREWGMKPDTINTGRRAEKAAAALAKAEAKRQRKAAKRISTQTPNALAQGRGD